MFFGSAHVGCRRGPPAKASRSRARCGLRDPWGPDHPPPPLSFRLIQIAGGCWKGKGDDRQRTSRFRVSRSRLLNAIAAKEREDKILSRKRALNESLNEANVRRNNVTSCLLRSIVFYVHIRTLNFLLC